MKSPTKPTPPRQPTRPTKVYEEVWPLSIAIYDESIADIIKKVDAQINNLRKMREDCTFESPGLADIGIEIEYGYDRGDVSIVAKWQQKVVITLSDDEYDKRLAKWTDAMKTYNVKLATYRAALKEYENDLTVYKAYRAAKVEKAERAALAKLRAKYKDTDIAQSSS